MTSYALPVRRIQMRPIRCVTAPLRPVSCCASRWSFVNGNPVCAARERPARAAPTQRRPPQGLRRAGRARAGRSRSPRSSRRSGQTSDAARSRSGLSPRNARALAHRIMQAGPLLGGGVRQDRPHKEDGRRQHQRQGLNGSHDRPPPSRASGVSSLDLLRWRRIRSTGLVRGLGRSRRP